MRQSVKAGQQLTEEHLFLRYRGVLQQIIFRNTISLSVTILRPARRSPILTRLQNNRIK